MPVSITEIKNRLPKEFMENLYEMFTPGMVDNILKGIIEKRYTKIRHLSKRLYLYTKLAKYGTTTCFSTKGK